MTFQLDELKAEVAALKQAIQEEKAQVDTRFAELETKIEELLTQPPAEMDLSEVLNDIRSIRVDVANIYEPAAEVVGDDLGEEEFNDSPTVILDPPLETA